jgi:O-antigen/teichoic acid export membrane protein
LKSTEAPSLPEPPSLFRRVSASVFWNTLLLPVVTVCSVVTSVLVRRRFGLASGSYDILLGLVSTVLFYSGFGIPSSLMKTLPEREVAGGRLAVVLLLWRACSARFALLAVFIVALHLFARPIASRLNLGPDGVFHVHVLAALAVVRAAIELVVYALYAFLAQLRVNLLVLLQSLLDPTFIAAALLLGYGIGGVVVALAASGALVAIVGLASAMHVVRGLSPSPRPQAPRAPTSAAWKFSLFDYLVELSRYFGGPDFSRMALAMVVADRGLVAIFAVAFYLAFMVVNLIASIFRGVYRPMFARLRAEGRFTELERAFVAISKTQVALLAPAGFGLGVMAADYVPLLYGASFAPAVAITRILIVLLFTETAFNQAIIVLSVDERYATVLGAMAIQVAVAPLIVAGASVGGIELAAFVLGLGRAATAGIGYLACRRRYGLRFPWSFSARVVAASLAMAAALSAGRAIWPTSVTEAVTLTLVGVVVFTAGLRFGGVLGTEEFDLLRRAKLPGERWVRWLFGAPATLR